MKIYEIVSKSFIIAAFFHDRVKNESLNKNILHRNFRAVGSDSHPNKVFVKN